MSQISFMYPTQIKRGCDSHLIHLHAHRSVIFDVAVVTNGKISVKQLAKIWQLLQILNRGGRKRTRALYYMSRT
jgi:hypothetical protein